MKKKIIFRIIGILGGILIISSVFLPYTSTTLWQNYTNNNQIYFPIIIIFFGVIPVLLNLIGKKEIFSYTSVGALIFFVVTTSIDIISAGDIQIYEFGFYILLGGILLVTISTILHSANSKINVTKEQIAPISNNMYNPMERKEFNTVYDGTENSVAPIINQNDESNSNILSPDEQDPNYVKDPFSTEIPQYQSDNNVNPVISEFTDNNSTKIESAQDQSQEIPPMPEVVKEQSQEIPPMPEVVKEQSQEIPPMPEVVKEQPQEIPPMPEVVKEQPQEISPIPEVVKEQPQEISPIPEVVEEQPQEISPIPEISLPQEVLFDDSQQAGEPSTSQTDIFGQPK